MHALSNIDLTVVYIDNLPDRGVYWQLEVQCTPPFFFLLVLKYFLENRENDMLNNVTK